jgi:hypothetical protein
MTYSEQDFDKLMARVDAEPFLVDLLVGSILQIRFTDSQRVKLLAAVNRVYEARGTSTTKGVSDGSNEQIET